MARLPRTRAPTFPLFAKFVPAVPDNRPVFTSATVRPVPGLGDVTLDY